MSNSEESQPIGAAGSLLLTQTATVVSSHEGEDGMGSRSMTVGRFEEIRRRLAEGRGLREIARAVRVASRNSVTGCLMNAVTGRSLATAMRVLEPRP
jgi:hypothetical protein